MVLDLFSGVGLMSLGLGWAGMRTVGFCEIEPACRFWLREQWPAVPIFEDVRALTGEVVLERCGAVDLVAGGFPCQPVSVAGSRKGAADVRWLWPEMFRLVRELRPRWVLAENVPGLRTLGADGVLADLDSEGYACWPLVVGADDAGASMRRKRVWILAHRDGHGRESERSGSVPDGQREASGHDSDGRSERAVGYADGYAVREQPRRGGGQDGASAPVAGGAGAALGDPHDARLALRPGERGDAREECPAAVRAGDPTLVRGVVARPGERQREWEAPRLADTNDPQPHEREGQDGPDDQRAIKGRPVVRAGGCGGCDAARESESRLGGPTDGSARRLARHRSAARRARLRAWGNGVYAPLVAEIGRVIMSHEA